MKTPRVTDFDPNANVPELGSPMDSFPTIQKPSLKTRDERSSQPNSIPRTNTPVDPVRVVPPVPLVRPVRPVPPTKRMIKQRHPFDIYQDQYESLKELALEERKQGEVGSMSAMVRAAIDIYITKKRRKEGE